MITNLTVFYPGEPEPIALEGFLRLYSIGYRLIFIFKNTYYQEKMLP